MTNAVLNKVILHDISYKGPDHGDDRAAEAASIRATEPGVSYTRRKGDMGTGAMGSGNSYHNATSGVGMPLIAGTALGFPFRKNRWLKCSAQKTQLLDYTIR